MQVGINARQTWRLFLNVAIMTGLVVLMVQTPLWAADTEEKEEYNPDPEHAVYDKNIYYFLPPSDGSGLVNTWGSEPIGHLGIHLGAFVDYAQRPMEYTDPLDVTHTVIYNQTGVNILAGIGLWDALNISGAFVTVPNRSFNKTYYEIYKNSPYPELQWKENATSDARVAVKYMLTNRRTDGIGIAFLGEAGLPTGDEHNFVSDEQLTIMPRFIFDFGNEWATFALNVGYKAYTDGIPMGLFKSMPRGNEYLLNSGITLRMLWGLELVGDYAARMATDEEEISDMYSEFYYAIRSTWMVRNPVRITIGGSSGLTDGVGTPIFRFYGGFNFFFREIGLP